MVCMVNATAFLAPTEHLNLSLETDPSKAVCANRELTFLDNSTAMSNAGYDVSCNITFYK